MRRFLSKKSLLLGGVMAIAVAAAAFAYLSATGSGTGTGSVTASASEMTLTASTLTLTNIGDEQTIDITAANSGTSPQRLESGLDVTAAPAATATGCPAGSFVVSDVLANGAEVPAGGSAVVATAKVTFVNDPANEQSGCIGTDTVDLTFSTPNS